MRHPPCLLIFLHGQRDKHIFQRRRDGPHLDRRVDEASGPHHLLDHLPVDPRGPVASALIWWVADRSAGQKYSSDFVLYWNSAIHVGCFLINAFSIAKTRETIDRQRELEAELARLRAAESKPPVAH